jgi:ribosomal protein S27AE
MAGNRRTPVTGGNVHGVRNKKTHPPKCSSGPPIKGIGTDKPPARLAKSRPNFLSVLPKSMLREIARVQRLAQEAGLFLEDRALLECPRCGLLEDVGCCGVLMTYPTGAPAVDSGLRFTKDKRGQYICPKCGAVAGIDKEDGTTA